MRNTTTLLLIFTTSLLFSQVPSYVPTNGLVGWWPFTGNANDLSGNGNHGIVNGPTLIQDRFGLANCAYSFDGINDFIQAPNYTSNSSFTFSCWVNLTTYNLNSLGANDFIFLQIIQVLIIQIEVLCWVIGILEVNMVFHLIFIITAAIN
jgi:hypothetical protein